MPPEHEPNRDTIDLSQEDMAARKDVVERLMALKEEEFRTCVLSMMFRLQTGQTEIWDEIERLGREIDAD